MTPRPSAALLAYRFVAQDLLVFIGHMGGPFWARRDEGGWSIPKGEVESGEHDLLAVARREFAEEIGVPAPQGDVADLGAFVQPSGKRVHAFAVLAPRSLRLVASNTFDLEWPRGSGRIQSFPEIDRADWFVVSEARRKVVGGQVPILDALTAEVSGRRRRGTT